MTLNHLQGTAASPGKRPYLKPTFECEQVFETMALRCGKVGTTSNNCKLVPKTS